jgi:single-strand DNA-binding protein
MQNENELHIIGDLAFDPEMRFTPSGKPVTTFKVPTNFFTGVDEDRKKETEWFNIETWDKAAEACNQYLHKGSRVSVKGRLKSRTWEKDGKQGFALEIKNAHVTFLDKKAEGQAAPEKEAEGEIPFE